MMVTTSATESIRMVGRCGIYDRKPDVCRNFPTVPAELRELPDCAYWFGEDGVRYGECAVCGVCCLRPYIYLEEFGKKFTEEPCPHLVRDGVY